MNTCARRANINSFGLQALLVACLPLHVSAACAKYRASASWYKTTHLIGHDHVCTTWSSAGLGRSSVTVALLSLIVQARYSWTWPILSTPSCRYDWDVLSCQLIYCLSNLCFHAKHVFPDQRKHLMMLDIFQIFQFLIQFFRFLCLEFDNPTH